MYSKLPEPDVTLKYRNEHTDKFFEGFKEKFPNNSDLIIDISVNIGTSDIKWNDMSGKISGHICNNQGAKINSLFSFQLVNFTGNCGAKAISHLSICPLVDQKIVMTFIESFAYHRTNCGILLGSDTNPGGHTYRTIKEHGTGYTIGDPIWNPNYTWNKKHKVSFFWKDLTKEKYFDYWQVPKGQSVRNWYPE